MVNVAVFDCVTDPVPLTNVVLTVSDGGFIVNAKFPFVLTVAT